MLDTQHQANVSAEDRLDTSNFHTGLYAPEMKTTPTVIWQRQGGRSSAAGNGH